MDPVTAGLILATEIVKFAAKVYEDTPPEIRQKNHERWDKFITRCEAMLEPPK